MTTDEKIAAIRDRIYVSEERLKRLIDDVYRLKCLIAKDKAAIVRLEGSEG